MSEISLQADIREGRGKGFNARLRDQGLLPAVIYGKGIDGTAIQLNAKEIERILSSDTGRNTIVTITLKGSRKKSKVMIRDLHKDPVKGFVTHVDFYQISLKDKIHTSLPIHLVGESVGVKKGGILQHGIRELNIECLPTEIPENIEIDISNLEVGENLTVENLHSSDEIHILSDPTTVIVSILAPKIDIDDDEENENKTDKEEIKARDDKPAKEAEQAEREKEQVPV